MRWFARLSIAVLLLAMPFVAVAQHKHSHSEIGPNGGRVEHLGNSHVELVMKGAAVQVYLYDEDMKAAGVQGAEITVTVQAEGKRETIKLLAAGPNLMQGQGSLATGKDTRAVVALKLPGKPIVQARFAQ